MMPVTAQKGQEEHADEAASLTPLAGRDYDNQWRVLSDFSRYNPGARHRRAWVLKLLKGIEFKTVLDVGCGNGELLTELNHFLAGRDVSLNGADFAPETVERNQARFQYANFFKLDIQLERLPRQFDLVICSEVIEHLADRPSAFRNLCSMVAQNGHLLITCPAGRMYETEKLWGHVSHPTRQEIYSLASDNGLKVRAFYNWGWPLYTALKYATNVSPSWSVKHFGSGNYGWQAKSVSTFLYWLNYLNLSDSKYGCQIFSLLSRA